MKSGKAFKKLIILLVALIIIGIAGYSFLRSHYVVPIMMYHNVEYLDHHEANWVSPKNFDYHMKYLREKHYNVISLQALVEGIKNGRKFPFKTVVVTFDDGRENVYLNAFDIIKKYNIPTIMFIPPDDLNTEEYLTYKQLKEMIDGGVSIGNHTRTQAYLPDLSKEEQVEEIVGAKQELEKEFGVDIKYFAYPIGGFNEQIKQIVRDSGHVAACTTNRGYDKFNKDVFELNRIRFSNKDNSNFILAVKLSGFFNLFRKEKNPD